MTTMPAVHAPPVARAVVAEAAPARLRAIDTVRGAAIVLMALDHVRDYVSASRFPPEDLSRATAALFATRWITHFCAPAFFLLAGVGIGLMLRRQPTQDVARFLVTRGLWLVVLELTVTAVGWRLDVPVPLVAIVLWALGWSMVVMAAAIRLPRLVLATLAALLIVGHNALDGIAPAQLGALAPLWHLLHVPGVALPALLVAYPLVPWVAVMAVGVLLADAYAWDAVRRRRALVWAGAAAIVAFVALRALNGYGDPAPWSTQRTPALTVASFLNGSKYPPSLLYLLMTLGPTLLALVAAERARGRVGEWLAVYGRVPLFFYVTHIYLAHLAGMLLSVAQGNGFRRVPMMLNPDAIPASHGVGLPGVYLAWALVVVALYPACVWFARIKATRREWWLRYL